MNQGNENQRVSVLSADNRPTLPEDGQLRLEGQR